MKNLFTIMQWILILFDIDFIAGLNLEPKLLNQVIQNTFNGYKCLNVYSHNKTEIQQSVLKEMHRMNYAYLLIHSIYIAKEQCGFILISKDTEVLYHLRKITFNGNVRILYIADNSKDILNLHKEEPWLLGDKDVLIIQLDSNVNIFIKSRYDVDFHHISKMESQKSLFYPKNYIPMHLNFNGRIIRVVTFDCPMFGSVIKGEMKDGVETRIINEVMKHLNFTVVPVILDGDERWGTVYSNGSASGGIIKYLHMHKADIGFCSLWIEVNKLPFLTLSRFWGILCVKFFVLKPKIVSTHWDSIFKPLPNSLWISILLVTLITTTTCVILQYMENKLINKMVAGVNVGLVLLDVIGILLMTKNPGQYFGGHANQHMLLWWSMFAMMIASLYSSSLVSHLTYPQFQPMMRTIEDLVKAGFYWGAPYNPTTDQIFNLNDTWHAALAKRFVKEKGPSERARRLLTGNYTVFVQCFGDKIYMDQDDVPSDVLHQLRSIHDCVRTFMQAIGYRKSLPYAGAIDRIIGRLTDTGIIEYWIKRLFEEKYPATTFQKMYEYKISPNDIVLAPLSIDNLQGAFLVLIIGMVLGMAAFTGELITQQKVKRR